MKILIVSATLFEVRPFFNTLAPAGTKSDNLAMYQLKGHSIDLLLPGIGMLVTAYHLGRQLALAKYDAVLNAGIAGSFFQGHPIGEVVEVTEDCVTELGAEEGTGLVSFFELGLMDPDASPYKEGRLINDRPIHVPSLDRLPKVTGSTVNTIHGSPGGIRRARNRSSAEIETMEGAAFLYSCLAADVPSAQIRSISNFVDERDKAKWDVQLALKKLNKVLEQVVREMVER
jgi:futalosine hydrolase